MKKISESFKVHKETYALNIQKFDPEYIYVNKWWTKVWT